MNKKKILKNKKPIINFSADFERFRTNSQYCNTSTSDEKSYFDSDDLKSIEQSMEDREKKKDDRFTVFPPIQVNSCNNEHDHEYEDFMHGIRMLKEGENNIKIHWERREYEYDAFDTDINKPIDYIKKHIINSFGYEAHKNHIMGNIAKQEIESALEKEYMEHLKEKSIKEEFELPY